MHYAIVINLDYETHNVTVVKPLFNAIKQAMMDAGFVLDGRYFKTDLEHDAACDLAREVIEQLNSEFQTNGESIYGYIKDFFCFDISQVTNLLMPPESDITVEELEGAEGIVITHLKP